MANHELELTVDLGRSRHGDFPFRVRLVTSPLSQLIQASERACRVYELLLIDRPGDIWDYVMVVPEALPPEVTEALTRADSDERTARDRDSAPSPPVPFPAFDRLFAWSGEDTTEGAEQWLRHRNSAQMRSFARQAILTVRAAQGRLRSNDPLLARISARVSASEHAFCFLGRDAAREASRRADSWVSRRPDTHTPAFYASLAKALRDPDVASVAYLGEGDFRALRMIATEQARRAARTGHEPRHALHAVIMVNRGISNEEWESMIWQSGDAAPQGNQYSLCIEGYGQLTNYSSPELVSSDGSVCKAFLATRDHGEIEGFSSDAGDGWVLYERRDSDAAIRRRGMDRRRYMRTIPILFFPDSELALFSHEKVVVVIGANAPTATRVALARVLADWQRSGGDPLLVIVGDRTPFDAADFKAALTPPTGDADECSLGDWFFTELRRSRPWIDVVIAIKAPGWATRALSRTLQSDEFDSRPWLPWIVASEGESVLKVDQVLAGDAAQAIFDAQQRAQAMQPRRMRS
ncbi:hypothetical protein [Thauera sp. WH-1]|uniref:hypothetical protein n=1 Tax=Thauera sp. WH-1 TaxID=3398230 RepID=UPI0039FD2CAD